MATHAEALNTQDIYEGTRNLDILRAIVERHQHSRIRIAGKTTPVDAQTANLLLTCYEALNPETKMKFVAMLAHSQATFAKTVAFCWKHVA